MIRAVKAVSTHRGRDPRDFVLLAFGGSGPVHAAAMARELGIGRVVVPPAPGLFSAFGLLDAAVEHHAVQTFLRRLTPRDADDLEAAYTRLAERALAELAAQGYSPDRITLRRSADLRYLGQSFELTVPLAGDGTGRVDRHAVAALAAAFGEEHRRTYGHHLSHPVEI